MTLRSPALKEFKFFLSSDIESTVKIKILALSGTRPKLGLSQIIEEPYLKHSGLYSSSASQPEVYVTCALYADGKRLVVPAQTSYHCFPHTDDDVVPTCRWNEWLTLAIKYRDLPLTTLLVVTIWDAYAPRKAFPVGGSAYFLFGKHRTLRKGRHKLLLWPNVEGDPSAQATKTPGKAPTLNELDRIEHLTKQYSQRQIPHLPWLDAITFRYLEDLFAIDMVRSQAEGEASDMFLYIEFPEFEFPVLFHEKECLQYVLNSQLSTNEVVVVNDPEISKENPVELKHLKLARSQRRSMLDRDLKPLTPELKQITKIISYPPSKSLTFEEKDLLWRFRFYLMTNKKALTKFLKCVDWSDPLETRQATKLLEQWQPIEVDDALELLSSAFSDVTVRAYAVSRLMSAEDDELLLYLLQLVQAMRYEPPHSPLAEFLISRAVVNPVLGNFLYWYLHVECLEKASGVFFAKYQPIFLNSLAREAHGKQERDTFNRQEELIRHLSDIISTLRKKPVSRPKKILLLKEMLSGKGEYAFLATPQLSPPLPMPLDPSVLVTGIIPDKVTMFKSAKMPLGITFRTVDDTDYTIIFKAGDDLRQDQLVIQLITLMDRILKKENLDLRLTPYPVLATSENIGMLECINSQALASVLKNYDNDIQKFLRKHHFDRDGPYGIAPSVLDNFVKSCAGYCVITYILGIGDRHLDNLLLTTNGNLFHIDFGCILGKDPKPLPPPMKLCKEMVEGMGGYNSKHYLYFKSYCCEAYNILRKSANLILNLFSLMLNANIPDIAAEPDKAMLKLQEKFRLELTSEEAELAFQQLINESVSALFPVMVEAVHRWAMYWRS